MDDRKPDASGKADSSVADEALRWLVRRLDSAGWTNEDEAALRAWLAASPEHEREFQRNESVVARMSRPEVFQEVMSRRESDAGRRWQRKFVWAWTGALAAAALIVFAFVLARPQVWTQEYLTGVGERREVRLPDGSWVHLDAQTRLLCRFDKQKRTVDLLAGAATFHVTPDGSQPFEVAAGSKVIRVVGTFFEVNLLSADGVPATDSGVSVAVTEGVVEVRSRVAPDRGTDTVRLIAGRKWVWRTDTATPEIKTVSEKAFAGWRSGRMLCEGEQLADVLVELGRYVPGRIELKDPATGQLRVSGTLPLDDWNEAVLLLESVLPIRVLRAGENRLTVESVPGLRDGHPEP